MDENERFCWTLLRTYAEKLVAAVTGRTDLRVEVYPADVFSQRFGRSLEGGKCVFVVEGDFNGEAIVRLSNFLGRRFSVLGSGFYWEEGEEDSEVCVPDEVFPEEEEMRDGSVRGCGWPEVKAETFQPSLPARLKTGMCLPVWLDNFIFNQLHALYSPDFSVFDYNLDLDRNACLRYLGTYFPRSFVETFCIFDNLFQQEAIHKAYNGKKQVSVLSVGCGTGGDIVGLLAVISKHFSGIKEIRVQAIDGNADALELLSRIADESERWLYKSIHVITRQAVLDCFDGGEFDGETFDFILTSKMINELIAHGGSQWREAYGDFVRAYLPLLSRTGLCLLLDVTTKAGATFCPILLNSQVNRALSGMSGYRTLLPRPCGMNVDCSVTDCFTQKEFTVTHSCHANDKSRVAYRVLCPRELAEAVNVGESSCEYLICNEKVCPLTVGKGQAQDAYFLNN